MTTRIAIVGIACRYPDARSPEQLWENVLTGRRAFRRLPDERMRLADYYSPDPNATDRFYANKAAVIEGFEFDRVEFKIAGSTYRSTDLTHWLALDTAAKALADAGFAEGEGLPKQTTAVIIGNSLTGEFSRANMMRLRWPYVRRTVAAALQEQGWDDDQLAPFMDQLEQRYKSPFPAVDEDMLAGGLSNTIAGRVCNHFDFKGGGYTVDGACSSSLLSVATACRSLAEGDSDVAIAGGVDLSIDPFEIIGFAKTGALSTKDMRVYDKNSNGFWPGEGCGMMVMMREEDAIAQGLTPYANIAGWGVSSDGKGGITRPEEQGHQLAVQRAYTRAGFGFETVSYIEGHGTGTAVGDATELRALSGARRMADPDAPPAAISTVKGLIGHTKAAAGIAGLLKATLAVHHQVIPPGTGCFDPHPVLTAPDAALRVPTTAEPWPAGQPIRAGVSSMGFGGINTHIAIEQAVPSARTELDDRTVTLVSSRQDAEILLLDADNLSELRGRIAQLADLAPRLAFAELTDLAGALQAQLADRRLRAAVVCSNPEEAERRLSKLMSLIDGGARDVMDTADGIFLGKAGLQPRIAFLFPGQGAGRSADGGALRRRFRTVDELYRKAGLPTGGDQVATEVAQPRIVTASVAGLRVLDQLGIEAVAAVGHSLGELSALHWAGAMDEETVLRLAAVRGRVMADASAGGGAMASIVAPPEEVEPLLAGRPVGIAGYNGNKQTVVSGPVDDVLAVGELAGQRGLHWTRVNVSHAFHSPLVAPAADGLAAHLATETFDAPHRRVHSTVTGEAIAPDTDLRELLRRQVVAPVRFTHAVTAAAMDADAVIEVGPGRILTGLTKDTVPGVPVVSLDTDGPSLTGLLQAVGAAFALGADVRHAELFADRLVRPLNLDGQFRFFASPCESAPAIDVESNGAATPAAATAAPAAAPAAGTGSGSGEASLDVLRRLAAARAELPIDAVGADSRPLDDLHLSSITVGQIMNQASAELGVSAPVSTTMFATATLAELAAMLEELAGTVTASDTGQRDFVHGVEPWVRSFSIEWVEQAVPAAAAEPLPAGEWTVFAPDGLPLAEPLRAALAQAGGSGVLLCLPADCDEEQVGLLLTAGKAAVADNAPHRFVVVQHGRGGSGLAKTLRLEAPHVLTTIVDVAVPDTADGVAEVVRLVTADVAATTGFAEVRHEGGRRYVPLLRAVPEQAGEPGPLPLGPDDVMLVTGGGKGITAECALAVAKDSGAKLALVGRSDPAGDSELAANLGRMYAAGVQFRYLRADVTSAEEIARAVAEATETLGPVTAVLHGAGRNEPTGLASLEEPAFRKTLAPKIDGLRAVLAAVDRSQLKLLVSFGSIIGRAGLRGEADYSTANDWLTALTLDVARENPACRCVSLEWSVWSGAGMGERLGVLESLLRDGITPIPTDRGIEVLRRVLGDPTTPSVLVVMGRAEGLDTIAFEQDELPLLRFIEAPRAYYPGVELVADAQLTPGNDLYLDDHLLDGALLFPAVIGMEAMAQVAGAVSGRDEVPLIENAEFLRPIVVPPGGATTIRVAALVRDADTVEAVIRSAETGFQADHFRATLRYARPALEPVPAAAEPAPPRVPIEPGRDLYGSVLFQGKRFQRLLGYRRLAARSCEADISNAHTTPWFGAFLPDTLVLNDPGTRDALMHSIQCCVPNATLLPAGIERLHLGTSDAAELETVVLDARERWRDGDTFLYDLDVLDQDGRVVERWEGLRLQAVRKQDGSGPWVPSLLAPYVEREVGDRVPGFDVSVAVEPGGGKDADPAARQAVTTAAVSRALGRAVEVGHRPDGRPEIADGAPVSVAHGAGVTLAVAADRTVGCDLEPVTQRDVPEWEGLLGSRAALAQLVARELGEDLSYAATRVWGVVESAVKAGRSLTDSITLEPGGGDGWALFAVGSMRAATLVTRLHDVDRPVVLTLLTEG